MQLSFHGADQGVTGSCHLFECNGRRILVDAGMYQGSRELAEENAGPFGFDPREVDYLLLTHAHLDHCGRIPLLFKRGFRGEIITTSATRELARLVMMDAANIQEEDARAGENDSNEPGSPPLYSLLDALGCMDLFGRTARYNQPFALCEGIQVTFLEAGHILGSASIHIVAQEGGTNRSLLFSGDLGYSGRAILRDPSPAPEADVVVMESTYGNRLHKSLTASIEELYSAINRTLARGGNVIIPAFALERSQDILYYLREGVEKRALPRKMKVFLDSPMAISATEIFRRHPECYDQETAAMFHDNRDPFHLPRLKFSRETAESIAINRIKGGAVIMAGSGMCTGGRIRHHLLRNLGRRECSVVFVGYAAEQTLARQIIDGAESVEIFHKDVPVRADIYTINGFSAHADREQLLAWHAGTGQPTYTVLVHGEREAMESLEEALTGKGPQGRPRAASHGAAKGMKVLMPKINNVLRL